MPTVVTHFVARVSKKADVPMYVHQLRHFAATQSKIGDVAPDASFGSVLALALP